MLANQILKPENQLPPYVQASLPPPDRLLFYECFHMLVHVLHQRSESNQLLSYVLLSVCHNKLDDAVYAL